MVIRGNTRGNGRQLAYYLLNQGDNEYVRILDADGWDKMEPVEFSNLLYDMSVTVELTKSKKGLYHAQINPAIGEDRQMSKARWFEAADILGKELGLENQRRAIVLHEKKGRIHAHVVWERYDHERGKMVSDSFSRLAQDRARMEMERVLEQARTPRRNAHRPELKATLSELWQKTDTAKQFMREVDKAGYMLAEGTLRHPFMVVDENGRTYDLVRQLKGVRIKEVRERMKGQKLVHEKEAIEIMRAKGEAQDDGRDGRERQGAKASPETRLLERQDNQRDITHDKRAAAERAREFAAGKKDMLRPEQEQQRYNQAQQDYTFTGQEITTDKKDAAKKAAYKFKENKPDIEQPLTPEQAKEQKRQRLIEQYIDEMNREEKEMQRKGKREKGRGRDYDD